MARQVTMEAALAAYRKKCGELFDTNVLLEARLSDTEQEIAALRVELAQARQAGGLAAAPDVRQGDDAKLHDDEDLEQGHGDPS